MIQSEQQVAIRQPDAAQLLARRAVADLDRDFLKVRRERRRQVRQRQLDQLRE